MTGQLVSIVLPTYNGSRYLTTSVESCIHQTYGNWELIIVDDGSTDATASIVAAHAARDPRIRPIRHETNRGLPAALNTGFRNSNGRYLTWTSDDNLYEPAALQLMVQYLQTHQEIGMVCCDVKTIGADGNELGLWRSLLAGEPGGICIQGCFLYRREVYEVVGDYDEDLFLIEDYDYWVRVNRSFRMARLEGVAPYRYRRHSKSLTGTRSVLARAQLARAEAKHLPPGADKKQFLSDAYSNQVWESYANGELDVAWHLALSCLWLHPTRWRNWRLAIFTTASLLKQATSRVRMLGRVPSNHAREWTGL